MRLLLALLAPIMLFFSASVYSIETSKELRGPIDQVSLIQGFVLPLVDTPAPKLMHELALGINKEEIKLNHNHGLKRHLHTVPICKHLTMYSHFINQKIPS